MPRSTPKPSLISAMNPLPEWMAAIHPSLHPELRGPIKTRRYAVTNTPGGNIEISYRKKRKARISVWPVGFYLADDYIRGFSLCDNRREWDTLHDLLKHLQKKWRLQSNPQGLFEEYEIVFDLTEYLEATSLLPVNPSPAEVRK